MHMNGIEGIILLIKKFEIEICLMRTVVINMQFCLCSYFSRPIWCFKMRFIISCCKQILLDKWRVGVMVHIYLWRGNAC